jgi:hypothetical protein
MNSTLDHDPIASRVVDYAGTLHWYGRRRRPVPVASEHASQAPSGSPTERTR